MRAGPFHLKNELKLSGIIKEINDLRGFTPLGPIDPKEDRWWFLPAVCR
jgi:hypothetical protein